VQAHDEGSHGGVQPTHRYARRVGYFVGQVPGPHAIHLDAFDAFAVRRAGPDRAAVRSLETELAHGDVDRRPIVEEVVEGHGRVVVRPVVWRVHERVAELPVDVGRDVVDRMPVDLKLLHRLEGCLAADG